MGLVEVFKIVFLPAIIAAVLYLFLAYVLLPFIRTHRDRYRQYLPLDSLSQHTSSLRDRVTDSIVNFIIARHHRGTVIVDASAGERVRESSSGDDETAFAAEDAEHMVGFEMGRSEGERLGGSRFGLRG